MKINMLIGVLMLSLLTACAEPKPTLTPLQLQSMQTRQFSSSVDRTFASTVSVFQDLGYSITSADKASGLISAESAATSDAASKFWLGIASVEQTRATAFIERIGKKTQVRLNFVAKTETSSGWGQKDRQDNAIIEATIYQNAFERIENAIFVRSN